MKSRFLLIALLLIAALFAGIFLNSQQVEHAEIRAATVLPAATDLPEFRLQDPFGNVVNADSFLGQWHLVFFGFTNCPDICPMTLQQLSRVKQQLAENGVDVSPRIVLVSVDPERDSAEAIGRYVDNFGDDNMGVTGDIDELQKLTGGLGIYFAKQASEDSQGDAQAGYNVDHSAAVLLFDPDAKFHALFSGNPTVGDYVNDLTQIFNRAALAASNLRFFEPLPGASMGAGYLTLSNSSADDIEITSVSSPQFDSVQIHETTQQDGIAKMRRTESLIVPANSSVTLREGGHHLMFHGRRDVAGSVILDFNALEHRVLRISARLASRSQP